MLACLPISGDPAFTLAASRFRAVSWVWKLRYDTGYMYLFQNSYYHW